MELQKEVRLRGLEFEVIYNIRQGGVVSFCDGNFEGDFGWVGYCVMIERFWFLGLCVEEE